MSSFSYEFAYRGLDTNDKVGLLKLVENVLVSPVVNLFAFNTDTSDINLCDYKRLNYAILPFSVLTKRAYTLKILFGLLAILFILLEAPIVPYVNSTNGFYNVPLTLAWTLLIYVMLIAICFNFSYVAETCKSGGTLIFNTGPLFYSLGALFLVAVGLKVINKDK